MDDMKLTEATMACESKAEKFKQLGTQRTQNVLHAIKVLSRLSNRSSYEYTNEQVKYIFSTIKQALNEAKKNFNEKSNGKSFKL